MARNRTISPDFWTREAVTDCTPMTRLLFIGLWNFADDLGVQPLRPRTIRMQIFPGDDIDAERMRAMIDELAAHGLVRIYEVDGVQYLAIVDWSQCQRVGKRARRRFPAPPEENVPGVGAADEAPAAPVSPSDHSKPVQSPPPDLQDGAPQPWRPMIRRLLHDYWPSHPLVEAMDDETIDRWAAKWMAEGRDYHHDILPAVRDFYVQQPGRPLAGLQQVDAQLRRHAAPA
jgi:hypothetical protein